MKRLVVSGAVVALGLTGLGIAQAGAPSGYNVTGGGQIDLDANGHNGNTLALQAQNTDGSDGSSTSSDGARGNLQYVDHASSTAIHYSVTCLVVSGTTATLGGVSDTGQAFDLRVVDADQGGPQSAPEPLYFNPQGKGDCSNNTDPNTELGHGNLVIHNPKQ